jgi:serpin B
MKITRKYILRKVEMKTRQSIGIIITIILVGLCLTFSGCSSDSDSDTTPIETVLVQSGKERNTSPEVSEEDMSTLVEGNTAFALDLYRFLTNEKQDENRFFSPYSISLCFAMAYGGARNNTKTQMEEVFHYTLGQDYLHSAFNGLALDLASREQDFDGDGQEDFKLNVANSMWGQKDYEFLTEYLDLLAENYGAGIRLVDLQNEPDSSCKVINDWVSENTEGLIDSIIEPSDLNVYSLFVLVNAIYFKAKWMDEFSEEGTHDDVFYTPQGEVTVPMMNQWCYVNYSEGENYQAAELLYLGGDFGMLILLPSEGSFEECESSLTTEQIDQIIADFESQEVVLKLPKFDCRPDEINLKDVLSQMGMTDAFIWPGADFSGMDGTLLIYLEWARHKAFVSVDEHGTEAAAATAIGGGAGGYPETPEIEFIVNRPFIFLIRDRVTGTILFMGRILDPS